jgi:predicted AlkP superfamily phosphohydrolase/phosphomutase
MLVSASGDRHRFFDLFYHVDNTKSGMHHPEGLFWVRVPGESAGTQAAPVPLTDVAPTILDLLDLPIPAAMSGRALLSEASEAKPYLAELPVGF